MRRSLLPLVLVLLPIAPAHAEQGVVIATMDEIRFRPPREKGSAELVEGKVGQAVRFAFEAEARSAFFTSDIHGSPDWDRADGFSFWVRGEGADGFGGLQFLYEGDYSVRYDLCFPVKGREWTRVSVAWDDLIPVLPGPKAKPLGTPGGNSPSKLSALWVGKWWYWGDYPAVSFALDEVRLESSIGRPAGVDRPDGPPLGRVLDRLKAGRPITIVTMGDSLTDKRHWANREVCWVDLLKDRLRAKYGSAASIVNPAIGGTQLRQNLVLIPRWLDGAPEPDLVAVFFGGNDRDAGMRGAEFERACADGVDRIRRATRGRADVLILTTSPTAARWAEPAELAGACREAARDRNAGLAEIDAAFRTAGQDDHEKLFVRDRVHLSRVGHGVVAEAVLKAIEAAGR